MGREIVRRDVMLAAPALLAALSRDARAQAWTARPCCGHGLARW